MDRRNFMKQMFRGIETGLLLSLFPAPLLAAAKNYGKEGPMTANPAGRLDLRDMAAQKLHHGKGIFLNPFTNSTHGRFGRVLKWKLFSENHFKKYYYGEKVYPVKIDWAPIKKDRGLSVTFLKHASIMIKDIDEYLIVDPVFSDLFWFIKDFTPFTSDMAAMPRPNHVLITHGHYDHLDTTSLALLAKDTHVISPLGYDDVFSDLEMKNRTALDWFHTFADNGQEITLVPCNHWTMRNPFAGPNTSLWGSYLIKTASGFTVFVSGDTAYFDRFQEIGREKEIDLAIFNLGAYEPRWFMAQSHINPRETVQAFKDLGAKHLMVVHWGTFRLGDEPVHFPPIQIKEELKKEGLLDRFIDISHGETVYYSEHVKQA
jgi:L-ascorbate metabolism protein UlaG (beta-lactamase superfamily)